MSIELSLGEVLTVAQRIGFELHTPPTFIDTTYTNNQRSMKQMVYRCAFFLLQRPFVELTPALLPAVSLVNNSNLTTLTTNVSGNTSNSDSSATKTITSNHNRAL
uniref:Uncharacterized protein n=1 Tax=Lygus hesperus TaxID=30085 RepID=A0A0A9ZH63_LYGHE